jgi:hypothetical protein
MSTPTYSIVESNNTITNLICSENPFFIARLCDMASKVAIYGSLGQSINDTQLNILSNNDGIYINDRIDIELYIRSYVNAINKSTHMACFPNLYCNEQNICMKNKKISYGLHNRALEPFYCLFENSKCIPWTHSLLGKKVLIVSPFVDSFKSQISKNVSFFGNDKASLFLPGQEFIYYKAYNTLAGNHPHKNWFETFKIMCNDIKKLDFDIALLSCGGYGLPLANFIFGLGKSAAYIGGGLQLLFGVYGKRWENHAIIGPLAKNPENSWIRPNGEEKIDGHDKIENGCYW